MGISVPNVIADQAATKIGCATLEAPFSYLGSKVGGLMWQINASKVGLSGVDHNGKKPIWVKWSKVLASKEKGGLGVSSFYALNRALLFKWVWRFCTQGSLLWARVIKEIHGEDCKLGKHVNHSHLFIWLDIVREMEQLKNHDMNLIGFIHKKMGNGADTSFREDVWSDDGAFKSLYLRIYALETCKNVNVAVKMSHENVRYSLYRIPRGGIEHVQFLEFLVSMEGVSLVNIRDRWVWSLEA
ncbi:hypothetical protein Tco_1324234 [Tanacetum coccineum]